MAAAKRHSSPRLFGIPATKAPVVAILRRGPSDWCQVGRWDLERDIYEPGAWLKGTIYPQKCDLSPDGRWLAYSAMKHPADWAAGSIYEAISRVPWLTALAAWEAGTTYTRGIHFTERPGTTNVGAPDVGDATPALARYGIELTRPIQFAVERRRGWAETADTAPRESGGPWDEKRRVTMEKAKPGTADDGTVLRVTGRYAGFRASPDWYEPADYSIAAADGSIRLLEGVQWADWDAGGRLLVATTVGRLQIRVLDGTTSQTVFDHDLTALVPELQPPPAIASEW